MIRERQREGIAKATEAGKYQGRKSTMTEAQVRAIRDREAAGEISLHWRGSSALPGRRYTTYWLRRMGITTMPEQTIYFDERTESKRVQVLKTYDASYARSCFDEMYQDALSFLCNSLDLESKYELTEPVGDLVWEDVEKEAREDGNVLSFFVVVEETGDRPRPLYVSPDWPSAEAFAKRHLAPRED